MTKRKGSVILKTSQKMDVSSMAFDQQKYIREFTKENYDRIEFLVPKGRKNEVKQFAKLRGKSVTELVVEALESYYRINLSKYGEF